MIKRNPNAIIAMSHRKRALRAVLGAAMAKARPGQHIDGHSMRKQADAISVGF